MPGKLTPQIGIRSTGVSASTDDGTAGGIGSGGGGGGGTINYAGMANNSWLHAGPGIPTMPLGISAYSGFVLDNLRSKILVFGGGHHDYGGNDVWSWDIANGGFTRLYSPDDLFNLTASQAAAGTDQVNFPGMWLASGKPIPRHTFNSLAFISHQGKMFAGGGSTWDGPAGDLWPAWGNDPEDYWVFDPVTLNWTYKGSARLFPSGNAVHGPTAYDGSKYLYTVSYVWTNGVKGFTRYVYRYDPDANTWLRRSAVPASLGEPLDGGCTFDTLRGNFIFYGLTTGSALWSYNVASDSWTNLFPTPWSPGANGPGQPGNIYSEGICYDSINDALIVAGPSGIWIYDYANPGVWTRGANGPEFANINGPIEGKLRFDASRNVAIFGFASSLTFRYEIWAYRYKNPSANPLSVAITVSEGA